MERMQIYQHVLSAYASAQKGPKKLELPPSVDKIVAILSEVPDNMVQPIINLIVTCEQEPRVLDALHKLLRERGLAGKPASKSGQSQSPRDLMASLGSAAE